LKSREQLEGRAGQLDGRVAIVTGATSGIGRGVATRFAAEGAVVVAAGRDLGRGQLLVEEITAAGGRALFVPTDLALVGDCRRLADRAAEEYGQIDILVNAAGVFPLGPGLEIDEQLYDRTFDVNVKGAYFAGQAALRHMLARGQGRIINFCSVASITGMAGGSLYCATKGALMTLTKAWAVEFGPQGVLVNGIAPGTIETPMNAHLRVDPQYNAELVSRTPLGRNGQVQDIVPAALLLAGDEGSFFCGSIIVCDGGWVAQ